MARNFIVDNAFRRFFGARWDRMTEEERIAAANDPTFQGQLAAQQDIARRRQTEARSQAFREEQARANPRNVSPGAFTWG